MKTLLLSIMLGIIASPAFCQLEEEEWFYGFKAGVNQSSISNIAETIIRPVHPPSTYETTTTNLTGYTVGFFLYHKFKDSRFAVQPEINFFSQGANFNYSDVRDLQYQMKFRYSYLSIGTKLKMYLAGGLHFSVGPKLSFNLDNSNLIYTSNMPELGPDLQIQQNLRQVLKGNHDFSVALGGGYDLPFGLSVEIMYNIGITDALETLANGFFFIENKNSMSSIHFTIGYAIPFIR